MSSEVTTGAQVCLCSYHLLYIVPLRAWFYNPFGIKFFDSMKESLTLSKSTVWSGILWQVGRIPKIHLKTYYILWNLSLLKSVLFPTASLTTTSDNLAPVGLNALHLWAPFFLDVFVFGPSITHLARQHRPGAQSCPSPRGCFCLECQGVNCLLPFLLVAWAQVRKRLT